MDVQVNRCIAIYPSRESSPGNDSCDHREWRGPGTAGGTWRPSRVNPNAQCLRSGCFSLSSEKKLISSLKGIRPEKFPLLGEGQLFYLPRTQLIGWGPPTLQRTICLIPSMIQRLISFRTALSGTINVLFECLCGLVSQGALVVKNSPPKAGDMRDVGFILGLGRSLGEGNGNPLQYSCMENPWTEEPGGPQSTGSQRVSHDWSILASMHTVGLIKSTQKINHHLCLLTEEVFIPKQFTLPFPPGPELFYLEALSCTLRF